MWRPNAQVKTLFSEILNTKVRLRVTTSALRYGRGAVGYSLGLRTRPRCRQRRRGSPAWRPPWLTSLAAPFRRFLCLLRRTIDKMGGLDNYIMQTPDDKLDSDKASELKLAMLLKQMRRPWPAQPGAAAGAEAAAAAAAEPKEP